MSNEANVQQGLRIKNGNFLYQTPGQPAFVANVAGTIGPTPGAVTVSVSGTSISLTLLAGNLGGFLVIINYDASNYLEWGVEDSATGHFIPVGEVLPGETYVWRLSRRFGKIEATAGTGTFSGTTITLYAKAQGGNIDAFFGAFAP